MSINKYTTNIQKRKSLILNKCSVSARLSFHSAIEYITSLTVFEGQQKSITRNISELGFYVVFKNNFIEAISYVINLFLVRYYW